jgi:hypothetical protein
VVRPGAPRPRLIDQRLADIEDDRLHAAGRSIAGRSIAGRSIAGCWIAGCWIAACSIAGCSIGGRSIAGRSIAGRSIAGRSIAGRLEAPEAGSAAGSDVSLSHTFSGGTLNINAG